MNKKGMKPWKILLIVIGSLILLGVIYVILVNLLLPHPVPDPSPCFKAIDQLEIAEDSCYGYVEGNLVLNLGVKRGSERIDLEGMAVTMYGEGTSETVEVTEVPGRRETQTYLIETNLSQIDSVEISPIVEGNVYCNAVDRKEISGCGLV